jgi:hypothetical protein
LGIHKKTLIALLAVALVLSSGASTICVYGHETSSLNAPKIAWQQEFMGGEGYSIYPQSDGGYVFNGANETATFIVKTDSSGTVKSSKNIQIGNDPIVLPYFVQTRDGGYAFAGNTSTSYVLAKTDSQGNILWSKTYPSGAPLTFMRAMIQTSDGGFALAGFEQIADESEGRSWFAKTDNQGNLIWNETLSLPELDCPSAIIQEADGGFTLSDVIFSIEPNYALFRLVRTDQNGNILWNQTYGDSGTYKNPECNSVIHTSDGGYLLSGWLAGGSKNAWIVKTSADGQMLWNQSYGERKSAIVGACQTKDGGYVLAATKNVTESWLLKTGSFGNQVWNITFLGATFAGLEANYNSVFQTKDGGYIVLGSKDGNVWLTKLESPNSGSTSTNMLPAVIVAVLVIVVVLGLVGYGFRKKPQKTKINEKTK